MKNGIFLYNNVIFFFLKKKVTIMKKNTIFHFFLNTKKKDRPKIYIIALDIFFFIFHFIFLITKEGKN
jgi:hypothetical protein